MTQFILYKVSICERTNECQINFSKKHRYQMISNCGQKISLCSFIRTIKIIKIYCSKVPFTFENGKYQNGITVASTEFLRYQVNHLQIYVYVIFSTSSRLTVTHMILMSSIMAYHLHLSIFHKISLYTMEPFCLSSLFIMM